MLTGDGRPLPGAQGGTAPRALEAGKVTSFQSSPGESSATPLPSHPLRTYRVSTAELGGAEASPLIHQGFTLPPPWLSVLPCRLSPKLGNCVDLKPPSFTTSLFNKPNFHPSQPQPHLLPTQKKNFRKIVWQVLKMVNMELPYDPATPLLGTLPKN